MKTKLKKIITQALITAQLTNDLPALKIPNFTLEQPKKSKHGDLACNLAMLLAKPCHLPPRIIAQILIKNFKNTEKLLNKVEIVAPGFINFFIKPIAWTIILPKIISQGIKFGHNNYGTGQKVIIELVSANPTGPLHIGHGRGAVVGDVLARLFHSSGFDVVKEYYINDTGNQITMLGRSILYRARELKGNSNHYPKECYQGDYIKHLASKLLTSKEGKNLLEIPETESISKASSWAKAKILANINEDLKRFGVHIDSWFSEHSLLLHNSVKKTFNYLKSRNLLYQNKGALWFKATAFGDQKDRVVTRSNGELTYFATDIAYHLDKIKRGFNLLINIWGIDHHGYVARLKASIAGLGYEPKNLTILLIQMVSLIHAGTPITMSTRTGEFITLKKVINEVGSDSTRFLLLTRRTEVQLDFDLELAKTKNMDNPVFYIQYAHTRVKSIIRKAKVIGIFLCKPEKINLAYLNLLEEIKLASKLGEFPDIIKKATRNLEPHRITIYLHELATIFHSYYNSYRILSNDITLTHSRLLLIQATGIVLANGLNLLGISTPEVM